MNDENVQAFFLLILRLSAIIVLVINAGIGLVLLRQLQTMNSVIRVQNRYLMYLIVVAYLLIVSFCLVFSFFVE